MTYTYASIVPLIGGETLGMQSVFGKRPEYILSYDVFAGNDKHLLEYYNYEVPYHVLDKDDMSKVNLEQVDVVNTVCPCAGLSSLSVSASADSSVNDWMINTTKHVLENMQPKVFWGENAPRLATKMGSPVVEKIRKIGKEYGYTFSIYKTKSLLHGLSQVRDRTFYFFWKGDEIPLFDYYNRPNQNMCEMIRSVPSDPADPMNVLTSNKVPSQDDHYYKFILEEICGGITHKEFVASLEPGRSVNPQLYIEKHSDYTKVADWLIKNGNPKAADKALRNAEKIAGGGNLMRRTSEIPSDYTGAFVGHLPMRVTHPDEDRYLTYREAMEFMKLPRDFNIISPKKNLNHICQNVPLTTAADMATNIKRYLEGTCEMIRDDYLIQDNKSKKLVMTNRSSSLEEFLK